MVSFMPAGHKQAGSQLAPIVGCPFMAVRPDKLGVNRPAAKVRLHSAATNSTQKGRKMQAGRH